MKDFMNDKELSPAAKQILHNLIYQWGNQTTMNNEDIGAKISKNGVTVSKAIKQLAEEKYISVLYYQNGENRQIIVI